MAQGMNAFTDQLTMFHNARCKIQKNDKLVSTRSRYFEISNTLIVSLCSDLLISNTHFLYFLHFADRKIWILH